MQSMEEPNPAEHWFRTGVQWLKRGEFLEAVRCLQHVIVIDSSHAEAWNNLGVILAQHGRFSQAINCFQRAIYARTNFADAARNLAQAQADLEKLDGQRDPFDNPWDARFSEAEIIYAQAISQLTNGDTETAERLFNQVLISHPRHGLAHYHLASLYVDRGQLMQALTSINQALSCVPHSAELRYDRARILLQMGHFEDGWKELEFRWKTRKAQSRNFSQPRWDGTPLKNGAILIHSEQGIGDVIQFVRYAKLVKERFGGRVYLACPPSLHALLATCDGVDQTVDMGPNFPPFDVQIPLLSLPTIFHTSLDTIPSHVPYLSADPELVEFWKKDLAGISGFKIGLAWRGNSTYSWDHKRSIPLESFSPLAALSNVRILSLLKGDLANEIRTIGNRWPIIDMDRRIDENGYAFVDTAAIMTNLDLVIAADTSAAHLAGALGVPVWLVQWKVPEWRWLINRETSPWYPSMRLFQQRVAGDWDELIRRIANEVQQRT